MNSLRRLSIKSQLLILFLSVGLGGILLVSMVAYHSGRPQMEQAVFNQLLSVRGGKAERIQGFFSRVRYQAEVLGEDEMIIHAMKEFDVAFQQLAPQDVSEDMVLALKNFYVQSYLPKLALSSDGRPELDTYFPTLPQAKNLQFQYIVKSSAEAANKPLTNDSFDGGAYAKAHSHFNPILHRLVSKLRYQDLLLISPDGNVVYSTSKNPDLGTSLKVGPYSESSLAQAFAAAHQRKDRGHAEFVDFRLYPPNDNSPAAFFSVPLFEDSQLIGVLALQLCVDEINFVMTGNRQWGNEGLGKSGEAYLVGEDSLMRSDPRFLLEDKANYIRQIGEHGISPEIIGRIDRLNTSVLLQPARTEAAQAALSGKTGKFIYTDYRGVKVLGAYKPISLDGINWGLIAKIDYDEAFAPVILFEHQVMLYATAFVILITLLALWLTARFVRPLHTLADAIQQIGEGRQNMIVEDLGQDEIGVLARAFNTMQEKLRVNNEELRQKNRENEALLLNMLPASIALRIKNGEQRIADSVASLTVLFADIIGFEDYTRSTDAEVVVGLLNEIVSAFDEAADRHGVEKVKTIGSIYMAVSGLSIPRIDHIHRMISFARELVEITNRINHRHNLQLALSIGINSGSAIAGIIGRQKFIYDLWGDTVNLAGRMQNVSGVGGIKVTQAVRDALGDLHVFERGGELELPGKGVQTIWVLRTP